MIRLPEDMEMKGGIISKILDRPVDIGLQCLLRLYVLWKKYLYIWNAKAWDSGIIGQVQ